MTERPIQRAVTLPPPKIVTRRVDVPTASSPTATAIPVVEPTNTAPSFAKLRDSLAALAASPRDLLGVVKEFVDLVAGLPQVAAAAYFLRGSNGAHSLGPNNWNGFALDRETFHRGVLQAVTQAARTERMQTFVLGDARNLVTFVLPIVVAPGHVDVLAASVAIPFERAGDYDTQALELTVAYLGVWHARHRNQLLDSDLKSSAAIIELVAQIESAPSLSLACHTIVNELRDFLNCDRVALALKRPTMPGCQLTTLSGLADFDPRSESARAFQSAADETAIRGSLGTWPTLAGGSHQATLGLRKLAELLNVESVVGLPLSSEGQLVATLVVAGRRTQLHETRVLSFLRAAAPALATSLARTRRLEGGWMSQTLRRARRSTWLQRAAVFGIVASSIGVLCLPQPYRVSASCTLEPVLRRIVCAPYDGLLEESLVEPGMLVERDATLARMDAREIRWELASVIAERHQARKDYERNLSGGEITKAQLAQLDDQRLGKKLELLEAREVNHELRSPVEGIVLKGSVERSSSVPVKLGQPLFEVAQLHPLRLEIDIPADDYAHVKPGQSVEVTLDGIADRAVSGTVEKIRPRSEIRDGRNVFVAEVVVANEDQLLRPGMRGRANIATASHPLVWNLFHKAWDAMWRSDPTTLFAQSNATTSQHGATQIANRPMRLRRDAVNDEEQPQLANRPTERGDDVLPPPRTVLIPDGIIRR